MAKESMIFYKEWRKAVAELPTEQRCLIYEAIFDYAFTGERPQDPIVIAVTAMWCKKVDKDKELYEAICERNRRNGQKGGRPKKPKETHENPVGNLGLRNNPEKPKETHENPIMIYDNNDNIISSTTINIADDVEEKKVINSFFANGSAIEAFCMSYRIKPKELRRMAEQIMVEWRITGQRHTTEEDARKHLINQLRIRINAKNKEANDTTNIYSNGNAGRAARDAEFANYVAAQLGAPDDEPDISGNY